MSEKENFPSAETAPLTKEFVAEKLKELGHENPEVRGLLIQWETQEDAEIKRLGDEARAEGKEFNDAVAQNERAIRQASIYYHAGYKEAALDALDQARMDAGSRGDNELLAQIDKLMDQVEADEPLLL